MVEVGQDVGAAPPQGLAELGQFLQGVGHAAGQRVDASMTAPIMALPRRRSGWA